VSRRRWLAAAAGVIIAALSVLPAAPVAHASTSPASLTWLIKSNDLDQRLAPQALADGVTLPAFSWVGCGYGSDPVACPKGDHPQVPLTTTYYELRALAAKHYRGVVIFDLEPWSYSHGEISHALYFIRKAVQLQQSDPGLKVVPTPVSGYRLGVKFLLAEVTQAAKYHAYGIGLQSQFADLLPHTAFRSFISSATRDIRRYDPHAVILAGLAIAEGPLISVHALVEDYDVALSYHVSGFWLNVDVYNCPFADPDCPKAECLGNTALGGPGCPQIAVEFLEAIGLVKS
jgi:hypothetical protein